MRLIDGDALFEKLNDIRKEEVFMYGRSNDNGCCTLSTALFEIECAPTIEPERKKGKWIFYETENEKYDDIKCPFCKKTYTVDAYRIDDIGFTAEDFKFCPNCGSDMRGTPDEVN